MAARMLRRLTAAVLVVGASVGLGSQAFARPLPGVRVARPTVARRTFNLFAGAPQADYRPNRVQCGIINNGTACVDPTGSPVNENGFWPAGSPDNYIFNSGLQIAGFVDPTIPKTAAFPWPGDTIGAFFFDPRGDQHHGEGLTNIYDGKVADDIANWPSPGMVTDTALFAPVLLGRTTASQEDLWYRYWDGNTSLATGRKHTMGLLVDQRFMAWNFPTGNNDILYTIVRFINITSGNCADYAGLSRYGYSAADIADICSIAQNYRQTSQAFYNVQIPAGGFTWTNVYASYAGDYDEGDASRNYSMGNLIFNTVVNYKADFSEPSWQLPPSIFTAPLLVGPGMAGIKYLKAPETDTATTPASIAMMGNTTNGGQFPDAVGVSRLWRNLSGNLLASDGVACDVPGGNPAAQTRRQCFWATVPSDTRIFGSSGPFIIKPGHAAVTAVALVFAGSVASATAATPGVGGNATLPAVDLVGGGYVGSSSGLPASTANGEFYALDGTRLLANQDTVKQIDRVMGFQNYTADVNGNGKIDQAEVITTPRSILDKEKVAQTVFDNKFLLPFAPDAPGFFLVPGDGQVTVVWQKSASETTGNPFYAVASQPLVPCGAGSCANALYDPNFRRFDVEGYRIWRGRTQAEMQVVAQFDYIGTSILDYTAAFSYGNGCAPELGVQTTCPNGGPGAFSLAADGVTWVTNPPVPQPLVGNVLQIPPGGRVKLADGSILNLFVDTAVTGGNSGYPPLVDNGVPFAYADNNVVNGIRYFYAVTAFSVNSIKSGPTSLQSPLITKTVTPRASSGQETFGSLGAISMIGADGTVLDPTASDPGIISTSDYRFKGPMAPTNGVSLGFTAFVPQLIAASDSGTVRVVVDSIAPSNDGSAFGTNTFNGHYYLHAQKVGSATVNHVDVPFMVLGTTGSSPTASGEFPGAPVTGSQAARFGGDSTFNLWMLLQLNWPQTWDMNGKGRYWANCTPDASCEDLAASRPVWQGNSARWWAGAANETELLPNDNVCPDPSSGGCVDTTGHIYTTGLRNPADTVKAGADSGHVNGVLPGIQYLWTPMGYVTTTNPARYIEVMTSSVWRSADFSVYWNATTPGKIDSVMDVTHHVRVPYAPNIRASWGILNDSSFTIAGTPVASTDDGDNAMLTFTDEMCVDPIPDLGIGSNCDGLARANRPVLMDHAIANPMNWKPANMYTGGPALVAQGATGNGFIFYINGRFFVMQMSTTLAACCQNTVWHMRDYIGFIRKGTPSAGGNAGKFFYIGAALWTRPPNVPGLTFQASYTGSTFNQTASNDSLMARIHTVPDPYYVTNALENTVNNKILRFVNLPSEAIIRIYSSSGILVRILTHNDVQGGSEEVWDLRNRNNQFVASGVYFYHVETPDGKTKIGRFTVVSYAQ